MLNRFFALTFLIASISSSCLIAQAAEIGQSCTRSEISRYYRIPGGYCMAEVLSCAQGKLVLYDGTQRPAPVEKCGEVSRPSCPRPMKLAFTLKKSDHAQQIMQILTSLSGRFYNLNLTPRYGTGEEIGNSPWYIEINATPLFEHPLHWGTESSKGQSREKLKAELEKKFPKFLKIETCPGQPETPSVIGSN